MSFSHSLIKSYVTSHSMSESTPGFPGDEFFNELFNYAIVVLVELGSFRSLETEQHAKPPIKFIKLHSNYA